MVSQSISGHLSDYGLVATDWWRFTNYPRDIKKALCPRSLVENDRIAVFGKNATIEPGDDRLTLPLTFKHITNHSIDTGYYISGQWVCLMNMPVNVFLADQI